MAYGPKQTLKEGFEKFVIKTPDACWDWSGCCPENPGYGQFRHEGKRERAHRASWIIHFGEIPNGMFVCHKCDNKRCSNPDHLFLADVKGNNLDCLKKGRHPTMGKKGSENIMAKLSDKEAVKIRNLAVDGSIPQHKIASEYNVSQPLVSLIKRKILRGNAL